ncbi:MAG: DNA mismatch repair endonuclease MutL [bacterium]
MSIHILDNNLINKIAAGEVVERPASVIKELVENALDAGSDFINVEIKNGGMDLIEITDNGKGMNKEDAALCIERHATSKISSIEDLHNITSFGFRGEALAAISSVSKFSVQTKERSAIAGTLVENNIVETFCDASLQRGDDNNNFKISDVGCPEGTKIRVENLFYNIPARRKFLKSAQTEFGHILNTMLNIAIVNYKIGFKLTHNGKVIFNYANFRELESKSARMIDEWGMRVKEILGSDNFSNMLSFYRESGEMAIGGFVSRVQNAKTVKNHQYLFVNNRPVYNNIVQKAIYEAYRNLIHRECHPMFVIKLEIEPELVDVNVHPRKMEVRFLNQQDAFKTVQAVIRESISDINKGFDEQEISNSPNSSFGAPRTSSNKISNFKFQIHSASSGQASNKFPISNFKFQPQSVKRVGNIEKLEFQRGVEQFNNAMFCNHAGNGAESRNWKLIGQVKNLYLIIEKPEGIILIDQHAAHERMVYDKLSEEAANGKFNKQQLLVPLTIELSIGEMDAFKNGWRVLENIGFEIEEFSLNTIIVQTIPNDLAGTDIEKILKGLISEIFSDMAQDFKIEEKMIAARDRSIKYISCHSAVRGGDVMAKEEQLALAEKVLNREIKPTCPHGRPIMVEFSWMEIGRMFKRS